MEGKSHVKWCNTYVLKYIDIYIIWNIQNKIMQNENTHNFVQVQSQEILN